MISDAPENRVRRLSRLSRHGAAVTQTCSNFRLVKASDDVKVNCGV